MNESELLIDATAIAASRIKAVLRKERVPELYLHVHFLTLCRQCGSREESDKVLWLRNSRAHVCVQRGKVAVRVW